MSATMTTHCPRCGKDWDGKYPPGSRATPARDIDVCGGISGCGEDEAAGRGVHPVSQWPIGRNPGVLPPEVAAEMMREQRKRQMRIIHGGGQGGDAA